MMTKKPTKKPTTKRKAATKKRKTDSIAKQFAVYKRVSALLDDIEEEEAADAEERLQLARKLPNKKKRSPADEELLKAAYWGVIKAAKQALAEGASPNARDIDNGHTALYMAVAKNQVEMAKFLLANGADVNETVVANIHGREIVEITPYTRATDENKKQLVKLLERHGGRYVRRPVM